MEPIEATHESRSSIAIDRTAKGEPTWHLKEYHDGDPDSHDRAMIRILADEAHLRDMLLDGGLDKLMAARDGNDPELIAALEASLAAKRGEA